MTDTDWKAALAANPRDPSLWLKVAEWLDEYPDRWEREKCGRCSGKGWYGETIYSKGCTDCSGTGSLPAMTAHRARLTWWRLMMEDEAWHGWGNWDAIGSVWNHPTFALLFDREESRDTIWSDGHRGPGKRIIPGHASELANYLESQVCDACAVKCSDFTCHCQCHKTAKEAAERVRGIRVQRRERQTAVEPEYLSACWWVTQDHPGMPTAWLDGKTTYPDACREAIRRITAIFTKPCAGCDGDGWTLSRRVGNARTRDGCPQCFGLGWRATLPASGQS